MKRAAPTERLAGYAFFLFTLVQVPFFVVESNLSSNGMIMLSPLQVTAANLAKTFPDHAPMLQYALVPGGWMREALSPFIRCQYLSSGKGPCTAEKAKLFDLQHIIKANNLPLLVELLQSNTLRQQTAILYGCAMIVVSALFSLYYSVKTAVLGFVLLAYGMIQVGCCSTGLGQQGWLIRNLRVQVLAVHQV
jgi:type III secretory pathway component EscS